MYLKFQFKEMEINKFLILMSNKETLKFKILLPILINLMIYLILILKPIIKIFKDSILKIMLLI